MSRTYLLYVGLSAVFAQYQNDMFVFNFDFIIKVKSVALNGVFAIRQCSLPFGHNICFAKSI